MPAEGIKLLKHEDILSFDEIVDVVKYAVSIGIFKFRITGGEPLVRKGIVNLIEMIANVKGVSELALTTNGILLKEYAKPLKKAGLQRVNVSLDAINSEHYKAITRIGNVHKVIEGLMEAKAVGLLPIKINCVIKKSHDEPDAQDVAQFAEKHGFEIRYIHQMDLETGVFSVVEGGEGGNCAKCNRIRLTAYGNVMPCLFSDLAYNVRQLGVENAVNLAIMNKPKHGSINKSGDFYNIGG